MRSTCIALLIVTAILSGHPSSALGQDAAAPTPGRPGVPPSCPYVGVPYLSYWKCQAALRRNVVHVLNRRELPHETLHITMRSGSVWVSSGPSDSLYWYLTVSGRGTDPQALPDEMFHAAAAGNGYEMRVNVADSVPELRPSTLMIFVPSDIKTLQVDLGSGRVLVGSLSGEVTITVEKGLVDATGLTGPALIENRDGPIKINLMSRLVRESLLKSSLNVLGRNGDIELTFPETTHAKLTVEAHQGAIVDSPYGWTIRSGDGDTIPVQLRPILGLKDNELRNFHRTFNGGGPDIKLVTLKGNVTLREFTGMVKSP